MDINPVYSVLKNASHQWPQNAAVHDDFGTINFHQLFQETEILKSELIELGIKHGMAVAVIARNNRYFIQAIFAVVGCGATVIPLSHQLKQDEIKDILEETQLNAILIDSSLPKLNLFDVYQSVLLKESTFKFSFTSVSKKKLFAPHVSSPAFMRFTSGTTGKAKGVIISHESALERIESANKILQLSQADTIVWVLPIAYHFVVSILLYVRYGAAIAIVSDFLPKNIIDTTNQFSGTLIYASPMQIRLLANSKNEGLLPSVKRVISTSAGISKEICIDFKKRFNIPVSQAYGIIEIGLPIINYMHSDDVPEAVGTVLPDYEVCIFDEHHLEVKDGEIGKLGIKGPGMFDAYLNPPVMREAVLVNGFFLTADFASKKNDLIIIEGREKAVINVSGNKIFPEEVEAVVETYPGIKTARVSGIPHPLMGQIIQAELILEKNSDVNIEELITYCRKRLSSFKIPQRVKVVDSFQYTGSGKLIRF